MAKKILIVDDSAAVRQQVGTVLKNSGFEVVEAVDGLDGQSKAKNVDMIISDVNMPNQNGLEMLASLKKSGVSVPVVMLTTEGEPELKMRAKAAGAKGWIVKPFKPELLVGAVKKLTGS